jgi:DNA repair protein SbcC/Rad50
VRPLELKLKGLRSYHTERTIPLADESLLAIVGDTGAGKSSLLEAIVFALYAGSTWDGREASELISDRTGTMVVELAFKGEGESWRVRRAMSSGSRPAEHELVCTSNPDRPRADGAHAVNREIKKLIGLTREQFCSAVLLPQGRFEELLHATPGERVDVLKGLLGLERAGRIRAQAAELEQALSARLLEISDRRGQFLPDPQAVANGARRRIADIEPQAERFEEVQRRLSKAEQDAQAKEGKAAALEQQADTLEPRVTGDAAKLDRLDQLERGIAERRQPLEVELERVERELRQSSERVEAAERERRDKQTLERGIEALDGAHSRLERLDNDQVALDERHAEADKQRATLAEAEAGLPALETALMEATTTAQEAASQVSREEERLRQLGAAIGELESKLNLHQVAERHLADNQKAAESAAALEEQHRNGLDAATGAREMAEGERDRLMALAPVANLAHDCHAGDPCPVCQHELPDGFEPPSADGLEEAKAAYTQAQKAERMAEKSHLEAAAALKQLRDARPALEQARSEALEILGTAEVAVRVLTEQLDAFERAALLERAREQAQTAERELDKLRDVERAKATARDERKDERDKRVSSIEGDKKLLESKDSANQRERERVAGDRRQILERIGKLRLPLELPDAPTTTQLAGVLAELRRLLPAAEQVQTDHAELLKQNQEVAEKLAELSEELQREVREPAIAARAALDGLRQELERLSAPGLPEPPEVGAPARELASWGEAVEKAVADELQSLRARADELRGEAGAERDGALARLAEPARTTTSPTPSAARSPAHRTTRAIAPSPG